MKKQQLSVSIFQHPVKGIIGFILLFIVGLTLLQDYLRACVNDSAFYFSESFLFSSFWWLLFPGHYFQLLILQRYKRSSLITWFMMMIFLPLVHLLLYPALVWVLSAFFYDHVFAYTQTLKFALSEYTYLGLLMYSIPPVIFHFYVKRKANTQVNSIVADPPHAPTRLRSILVSEGYTKKNIAVESIYYMSANPPYVNIYTDHHKYLHTCTLRSISTEVDPSIFIRVHRSTIVNILQVASYTTRLNGDYDLQMKNNSILRLSRNYANDFKILYQQTHPLTSK